MTAKDRKYGLTKFYQEDMVQLIDKPDSYGIVLRCWHDAEDLPPPLHHPDPLMRPLKRGEVGVSFFPHGVREIISESRLKLVDRSFSHGDLCKRSIDDVRSATVTDVAVKLRLRHVINGVPLEGWKTLRELDYEPELDVGDHVVYDNWIGQIIEMFDEALVEISNGQLVKLPEIRCGLAVGDKGKDILQPVMAGIQSLFQYLRGQNVPPSSSTDTVVSVKHTVLAISWLAINQSLDPTESQNCQRPARFWSWSDLPKLTLIRSRSEQMIRIGDRVHLKPSPGLPMTVHGGANEPYGSVECRTFVVFETTTAVFLQWQNGEKEIANSTELIPYLNPDEYDCWPGDQVDHKTEDQKRAAIVQSVNSAERTALIRYFDSDTTELASVLELDPYGATEWSATITTPPDGLGVRRGDFVFIHREGKTNGLVKPRVPRIGELESWVRELPQVGFQGVYGWRKDMMEIGMEITQRRLRDMFTDEVVKRPQKDDKSFNWFGEVSDLLLDGTVEVILPDTSVVILPLERLTKLNDGLEQLEEMLGEDMSDTHGSVDGDEEHYWAMDSNGVWQPAEDAGDKDEWEETDDDDAMDVDGPEYAHSVPTMDMGPTPIEYTLGYDTPPVSLAMAGGLDTDREKPQPPDVPEDVTIEEEGSENKESENTKDLCWKRFDLVPSTPPDHAFYTSAPAQPSRNFLARLTKEYRVLSNSLPDSIVVRAYEDRTDLLRSLIIGPENTPYEDAPFVIDWMLDSNFPNSPPIAHFHSWTNGNGRVNPNLYEEGKVCLSILGTWAGDRNEVWNPGRSSLLQVLVSIQALVLVKEPWFCEPAYDKLRGTEEATVNSRLYNEKAFVLARGFVRRALEVPLGSIESEIQWMYYANGRLEKVLRDSYALIEKSRASSEDSSLDHDLAVPRLTPGGIISLERTLHKLKALLETHHHT